MVSTEREDDYKFLQIVDAMASINQRVNLIGIVVETSIPKQTKGTDCFCTIKIVDESRPSLGISVNIFAENMEKLPHVESAGDIIQVSHVVMKTHASEVYALFNKKFSSFALFEGKHGADFIPYQASSKFCARAQDKKFVLGLRKWLRDNQVAAGPNVSSSLKEIREGERFHLICKVLHICEVTRDDWMLFVWDGTDTPPVAMESKLEDEIKDPLPLQLEPFPLPRDILCKFPTVGTVLRVIADQGNEKLGFQLLKAGKWVKLVHVKCEIRAGLWNGVLMPFSKVRYLSNDDDLVLQCLRLYEARVAPKWGRMPLSSFPWPSHIAETDCPDVPFVTLMDVLTYPEVTAKFRCVVRVVATLPWKAEDFCSPLGTYRIRLTLEDPTARIHAFLYADDGATFFGGYLSIDEMMRKQLLLLGVCASNYSNVYQNALRNPPWVQCCLRSYYIDRRNIWGSRNYRVFATRMVG